MTTCITENAYNQYCSNLNGLEIGGPSWSFFNYKIYFELANLDGINFSSSTVWNKDSPLEHGENKYKFLPDKTGFLYLSEATDLSKIKSSKYDIILSSNNLEHIANPIKALKEWIRVLKPNGLIFLVLPKKELTFDHRRNITTIDHMIEDYIKDVGEGDQTHLQEILSLHDLSRDPLAGNYESFKIRCLDNKQNRCLHHHVFDLNLIRELFHYLNIEEILMSTEDSDYYALGRLKS